ncbi:hypothetical protein L914_10582 [Phytophthora nicotianae]|uniref:Uncharacterized protein n=2 Tax=Phytophthora nicotianae TaxID=4792 RepID=W2N6I0_PHYNI|nr:hypothetical protein L914_10582 [Phytophthora nicotianae]ETO72944.1 hypothetical protein F444_11096 [Phytophthora nicotianae P1976]
MSGDHVVRSEEVPASRGIHKHFRRDLDLMFASGETPLGALDQLHRMYDEDAKGKRFFPILVKSAV